ncbi:CRISPR-associated helicase Cas3 [Leptospira fainei serovar Hurstbridge str. BUT 6]|uniref:CRISPR-associated helicase Cas3 n=1 Tax=Leptospira fainei serovar Hurstbridge str. BUT 6 TaxID=1193011 RepID=S3VF27_9LEPT|nr:CRISPR-associated helicase/endonuclease Cas3 [Leptospira fainei]EPG75085.1 CRISPR-associated helicase Cas3 [Leptospira fainei serovar Hurstbridge str. BUT 6]
MSETRPYLHLWGKANKDEFGKLTWHPLVYHMLDVAAVAWIWLEADKQLRRIFTDLFGWNEYSLQTFGLATALHDIGKASLGFQNKIPEIAKEANIQYSGAFNKHFDHGAFGGEWILNRMETEYPNKEGILFNETFQNLWKSSCWHHGSLILNYENYSKDSYNEPKFNPNQGLEISQNRIHYFRSEIIKYVLDAITDYKAEIKTIEKISASDLRFFAGFVSVCDWVGSDSSHFTYCNISLDPKVYFHNAKEKAKEALSEFDLISKIQKPFMRFQELFPEIKTPRPLQKTIESINFTGKPYLLIIEAPTGEGKTESALFAHSKGYNKGFFFGLPTQGSANQISNRVNRFLIHNLKVNQKAILAHGTAWLNREVKEDGKYGSSKNNIENTAESELSEWFFSKKRTLLAPYGVGTIDQAMLAALNVKHGFVKLFGLSGKTLIIDEVHAYDSFMLPIIERLLEWCASLRANVILLSATLPSSMKERLLCAYSTKKLIFQRDKYPLISYIEKDSENLLEHSNIQTRKEEIISIQFATHEKGNISEIANKILESIQNEGNVLWICNTIQKAQQVYSYLKDYKTQTSDTFYLKLFHSRFKFKDRKSIEQEIESLFGPENSNEKRSRPKRGILIATQVAEQSLDIDFDYLVTDIAPIDLLLQRLGRIHRHNRINRASRFSEPSVLILIPASLEEFKSFSSMYYEFTIAKTLAALSETPKIRLPQMYRNFVEEVYSTKIPKKESFKLGEIDLSIQVKDWNNLYDKLEKSQEELDTKGSKGRIPSVKTNIEDILQDTLLSEEDNAYFVAKTRDGDSTLQLIPVHSNENKYLLDDTLQLTEKIPEKLSLQLQKFLAENTISVSSPRSFVRNILKSPTFLANGSTLTKWQNKLNKIGPLKGKYFILLDQDRTISHSFGKNEYHIQYDTEFGLRIQTHQVN